MAYTLAAIGDCCKRRGQALDWQKIWAGQSVYSSLEEALVKASSFVNQDIIAPPQGISNISEWCKKDACWTRIQSRVPELERQLPGRFFDDLTSLDQQAVAKRDGRKTQEIDNGIDAQTKVLSVPIPRWTQILEEGTKRKFLTPKEVGILQIARQMPAKLPTPKQSAVLVDLLEKAVSEGLILD